MMRFFSSGSFFQLGLEVDSTNEAADAVTEACCCAGGCVSCCGFFQAGTVALVNSSSCFAVDAEAETDADSTGCCRFCCHAGTAGATVDALRELVWVQKKVQVGDFGAAIGCESWIVVVACAPKWELVWVLKAVCRPLLCFKSESWCGSRRRRRWEASNRHSWDSYWTRKLVYCSNFYPKRESWCGS